MMLRLPILLVFAAFASFFVIVRPLEAADALPKIPPPPSMAGDEAKETENGTEKEPPQPLPEVKREFPQGDFKDLLETSAKKVISVIDPLTIQLDNKETTRLSGIDIPDLLPYDTGPVAQAAKAVLTDMLKDKSVKLYVTKDKSAGRKNRMGHMLYHMAVDGSDAWVQGTLVRLGLARVRTEKSNPEMAAQLYELERQARTENLGLWATPESAIKKPEDTNTLLNSYQVVEGRIESVSRRQNMLFLNFGKDWRKDFTIGIKSANNRGFLTEKINLMEMGGQVVRVRGWVRDYNGPFIEIDHPQMIEIVK